MARARAYGQHHAALTDDGNLFGAVEFYHAAKRANINPILGCDFYLAPNSRTERASEHRPRYARVTLLATNAEGFQNLVELSSRGYSEGFYYKPRIDYELLSQYHHHLVAFCGGLTGDVGRDIAANRFDHARERAEWYRDLFGGDRFYLELQQHNSEEKSINSELARIASQLTIPLVATNNCYYTAKEDAKAHEILRCIGRNKFFDVQSALPFGSEHYIKSPEEMGALFADYPQALENTLRIAEMCNVELNFPGPQLPRYDIPEGFEDAGGYLRHLAHEGFRERYAEGQRSQLNARLEFELDTIVKMGFPGYFLIVWDLMRYARTNQIPVGPGRGSGVGSLVAYSLRITNIDPIKYGLIFERFLNPERVSMPDFDIDFCYERRGEIIEYITKHYGSDHVGQIITFGSLKARAVVRDVARVLGIAYSDADRIAKLIPMRLDVTLRAALEQEPALKELIEQQEVYRELIEISLKLEGLHRHASTHAAGVVIGRERLTNYVPLYRDPKSGAISTQYSMEYLEERGLVKMDILGLKTLTLVKNSSDLIAASGERCDIERIPDTDADTFAMLAQGDSGAIFQFEAPGMQRLLRRAQPNCIEDLIALTSLYRPGPMDNIDQYINAKRGNKVHFPLKLLEEILRETYGVIIYQEQVIEIVQKVAGFSPGRADIMRRAMGKKKSAEMKRMKREFVNGAIENHIARSVAEKIFDLIIPFAGYGFNKSHAAAYSVLAYQTAYLKRHFPRQFMAANLTNEINSTDTFMRYLNDTRQMGIKVLPPDINRSQKSFSVAENNIIFGLIGIKNIGTAVVEELLRARTQGGPFKSFDDVLARIDTSIVNKRSLEACILAGLFDSFGQYRATLFHNLPHLLKVVAERRAMHTSGQQNLFALAKYDSASYEQVEEFPHTERMLREREMLGAYFTGHPLDEYRELWERVKTANIQKWKEWSPGTRNTLLGRVMEQRTFKSKRGARVTIIQLEDYNGNCEIVWFDTFEDNSLEFVEVNAIVGVEVELQERNRGPQLIAQKFFRPQDANKVLAAELHIKLAPATDNIDATLRTLRDTLLNYSGKSMVYLHLPRHLPPSPSSNEEVVIRASGQLRVSTDPQVIEALQKHSLVTAVWCTKTKESLKKNAHT